MVEQRTFKAATRQFVSQNRRRYQFDDFDIDVTYVTAKLIAMSVPSEGVEAFYRNPIGEVVRFFQTKHADHYCLFNLVPERKYSYARFGAHRVVESFMGDHNPAPLHQLIDVCGKIHAFLSKHPGNTAAVHCKGGKGRTGTVLCCYLLYSQQFVNADAALDFFADQRTSERVRATGKKEGVEARSQERYVRYFAHLCDLAREATRKGQRARGDVAAITDAQKSGMLAYESSATDGGVTSMHGGGAASMGIGLDVRLLPRSTRQLVKIRVMGVGGILKASGGMWFQVFQVGDVVRTRVFV
jgi:protein-tyrosine phosphatase